ncbi:MAG: hypothetical protein J6Y20_14175, partial [Lachnospiraceae bacterium]|nr:hypothetical protein [Lachnospiraceae bacterium]
MEYKISTENIRSGKNAFVYGEGEWSGVLKIADRVADDMKAVFGRKPELTAAAEAAEKTAITMPVLFGTVGKSALIASLGAAGIIDLSEVEGKREVYSFTLVRNCPKNLVTAGAE